jgi:hypothetical protein
LAVSLGELISFLSIVKVYFVAERSADYLDLAQHSTHARRTSDGTWLFLAGNHSLGSGNQIACMEFLANCRDCPHKRSGQNRKGQQEHTREAPHRNGN